MLCQGSKRVEVIERVFMSVCVTYKHKNAHACGWKGLGSLTSLLSQIVSVPFYGYRN